MVASYVSEESRKSLDAYEKQDNLLDEHANHEEDTARGGYAHRQLLELIQNSADALANDACRGRIAVRLTRDHLYCADDGKPIDQRGVRSLMFSHLSPKRGTGQIGRFGLGFKSVLGVTNSPEFFSRSGSFRFDRCRSQKLIQGIVSNATRFPVLRLAEPIDPSTYRETDSILRTMMEWAANIVRLPLTSGADELLRPQMRDFPPEFLLFVKHVRLLELDDDRANLHRTLKADVDDDEYVLADGETTCRWRLFTRTRGLSSDARADSRDDEDEVSIWWAAPLGRSNLRHFWAFFPTQTASLVKGILNAPWKTNEDRQNLLPGPYNDELIEAAAELIADNLPSLSTQADLALHLDLLPRRHEAGDTKQSELLRTSLFSKLHQRKIVPDQDGNLQAITELQYPPKPLTESQIDLKPFEQWTAYPCRPSNWLHHKAITRTRLATIDRLTIDRLWPFRSRSTLAQWLEALVHNQEPENAIRASMAAIRTAVLIPSKIRSKEYLGKIVLTADEQRRSVDPTLVYLPDPEFHLGNDADQASFVHQQLASDPDTLSALKRLGIKKVVSAERSFKRVAEAVLRPNGTPLPDHFASFWKLARKVAAAGDIIKEHDEWRSELRVCTRSADWKPLHSVLLPGKVVPGDGSRDDHCTVDTGFHQDDIELIRSLGATETPVKNCHLFSEPWFRSFLQKCEERYRRQKLKSTPQSGYLIFESDVGSGPLHVLTVLSDEGAARYTHELLLLDSTYEQWRMQHKTRPDDYPKTPYESPAPDMLRGHGKLRTPAGILPFSQALGQHPESPAAWRKLITHPEVERIREAFDDLTGPTPEFFGEESPASLVDVWPGLKPNLSAQQRSYHIIRCERIVVGDDEQECVFHWSQRVSCAHGGRW